MNKARIAAIALCLLMMVLPSLAIPFFQGGATNEENRSLADFPELWLEDEGLNGAFDRAFEEWLCDHFALRTQAVRANALLNYKLLHTSPNADVIAGKGDWLYYAETAADYTGEGRLTDAELATVAENLRAMGEALEERGARLYLAVVPNKSTVYPQYMPDRYPMRRDEGNIARLRAACEGLPVTWIDLEAPLRAAAQAEQVYLRTDTHWNRWGAALCADALLAAMGREPLNARVEGTERFDRGDLARLMGLSGVLAETAPAVRVDAELSGEDFSEHVLELDGDGEGSLLVFRDSFGIAIGPYLTAPYGHSELYWQTPLEVWHDCDDALILVAERNIRMYLLEEPELEDPFADEDYDDEDFDDEDFDEDYDDEEFDDEDIDDEDYDDEEFDEEIDDEEFDDADSEEVAYARALTGAGEGAYGI